MPVLLFEIQTEELPPEYLELSEKVIGDVVSRLLAEGYGELPRRRHGDPGSGSGERAGGVKSGALSASSGHGDASVHVDESLGGAEENVPAFRVFAAPRQLAVLIDDLPEKGPSKEEEIKGPPVSIAYSDGVPTRALEGFLRKNSATMEQVYTKEVDGREYVFVKITKEGMLAKDFAVHLADAILEALQKAYPKKMYWGNRLGPFARPVRGFILMIDDEVVPFERFGVSSGRTLKPHRFAGAYVDLQKASDYIREDIWEKTKVIPDRKKRYEVIKKQVSRVPGVVIDEDIVWHNADLTGYPRVFVGSFDERFRELPVEVARTVLATQLQCFICLEDGRLSGKFVGVSDAVLNENVRVGYERVVRARFSDAEFFFRNDLSSSFEEWNESLKGTVYLQGLGSMYEKEERLKEAALKWREVLSSVGRGDKAPDDKFIELAAQAASICKADLSSEMVYEFPELEGTMGRIYALKFGYPEDVAYAIEEHYLPRRVEDSPPERVTSQILSLLDKIDTVVGVFGVGKEPTGSADPFAVRRAALGIVRTSAEKGIYFPVPAFVDLFNRMFSGYDSFRPRKEDVIEFISQRAYVYFQEGGFPYHFVRAVLAASGDEQFSPSVWKKKLEALASSGREELEAAAIVFRRVNNIVEPDLVAGGRVDVSLLVEEAEKALFDEFGKFVEPFNRALEKEDYGEAIKLLLEFKPHVDRFFDDVLVNVDVQNLRRNRHRLLWEISSVITKFVDFSHMVL